MLKYNFADMYFREFLRRLDKKYVWFHPKYINMYRYNTKNPDSITKRSRSLGHKIGTSGLKKTDANTYEIVREHIRDQMLLKLSLLDDEGFKVAKRVTTAGLSTKQFNEVFPNIDRIKKMCRKLYDRLGLIKQTHW